MATATKVLARTAASLTTTTVLYTVPASTTTVVSNIAVTNTASSAGTFTMAMGPSAGQIALHTTTAIAANSTVYIDLKQVLEATNTITGGASATTINFHISGVEVS
jgi:6-phosphofructokinase